MPAAAPRTPGRHLASTALALAAAALALAAAPARAERNPLRYNLGIDLSLTLGAAASWGATEALKPRLAPTTCRICATNAFDAAARERLRWSDPKPARTASDVLMFGVVPAGIVAHALLAARAGGDPWKEGFVDLLVITEAATVAGAIGQAVKLTAARARPFLLSGGDPDHLPDPDDNLSLWSGHSSMTFSLAVAAGTVAFLRGDRSAPWVLGVGLAAASATGYLRVAGDKHHLSDVLIGAAVGSLAGWAIPYTMHRTSPGAPAPGSARGSVTPLPLGFVVVF
jgi:membrane-associated phospholipid phosphatase